MHVLEQYRTLTPYLLGFSWPLAIARLHGNLACGRGRHIIGPSIQYAAAIFLIFFSGGCIGLPQRDGPLRCVPAAEVFLGLL